MSKGQLSGLQGTYLVAAQMCSHGLITAVTSRGALGADIVATTRDCTRSVSVQVKTNSKIAKFWLLGSKQETRPHSEMYFFAFVNINPKEDKIDYYVVPSMVVSKKYKNDGGPRSPDYIMLKDIEKYNNNWSLLCKLTD